VHSLSERSERGLDFCGALHLPGKRDGDILSESESRPLFDYHYYAAQSMSLYGFVCCSIDLCGLVCIGLDLH